MANRLKTVEYWFPMATTVADNSATALTQITVYLPEGANIVEFRTVHADLVIADRNTTLANVTSRVIALTLQGATASTVTNSTTYTQSGEQFAFHHSADFTAYFNANWGTNTSRTLDASITVNTGTLGCVNASMKVVITYVFDDVATTHVKTVWIPLNADVNALPTTKPGTPTDTIPALDSYLPEASKTIRQITIVSQGNLEAANTTDKSRSWEIDTAGVFTSGTFECGLNSDFWYRLNEVVSFDTSTTHSWYSWASATDFDHPQNYMVVTYEFSPGSTTRIMNSLLLPMEFGGAMGGPTSADYQRGRRELWVQEPGTITLERLAALVFYDKRAAQSGLNARVGSGSFVAYSCVGGVMCGGAGLMIRNDGAFTLSRGRNSIFADIYNTDASDLGYSLAALWMVNYTSDVPANGVWAANHTVIRNLKVVGTTAATAQSLVAAVSPSIPETNYFVTSVGINYVYTTNSTGNAAGVHIGAENSTLGGWENVYEAMGGTDPETGIRQAYATARSVFNRWNGDPDTSRLDLQTDRRWRVCLGGSAASFDHLDMYLTYHSITFTVADNVSGFTGTVNISAHRADGERVLTTSRSGDGAFSMTWYDNTEQLYVVASDGTNVGRSELTTPAGSP